MRNWELSLLGYGERRGLLGGFWGMLTKDGMSIGMVSGNFLGWWRVCKRTYFFTNEVTER